MSIQTNSRTRFKFYIKKTDKKQSFLSDVDFGLLRPHKRHPDDMVILPYSSGTTGLPKGVMLSHNNIAVNCEQLGVKFGEYELTLPTTEQYQDVSPSVLPFFHIYGFTVLMISKLALGVKVVTLPEFKPETFVNSIRQHKATIMHLVPPICKFFFHFCTANSCPDHV